MTFTNHALDRNTSRRPAAVESVADDVAEVQSATKRIFETFGSSEALGWGTSSNRKITQLRCANDESNRLSKDLPKSLPRSLITFSHSFPRNFASPSSSASMTETRSRTLTPPVSGWSKTDRTNPLPFTGTESEVKATTGQLRSHEFSLEQQWPNPHQRNQIGRMRLRARLSLPRVSRQKQRW